MCLQSLFGSFLGEKKMLGPGDFRHLASMEQTGQKITFDLRNYARVFGDLQNNLNTIKLNLNLTGSQC